MSVCGWVRLLGCVLAIFCSHWTAAKKDVCKGLSFKAMGLFLLTVLLLPKIAPQQPSVSSKKD